MVGVVDAVVALRAAGFAVAFLGLAFAAAAAIEAGVVPVVDVSASCVAVVAFEPPARAATNASANSAVIP